MKPNLLPCIEWDFAAVPDSELVACCYWEYARESKFVLDTVAKWRALPRERCGAGWTSPDTSEVWALNKDMQTIQGGDQPTPHIFGNCLSEIFSGDAGSDFPAAWQTLTIERRAKIAAGAKEKSSAFLVHTAPVILSALARQAEGDLPDGARPSLKWYDGETLTLRIAWRYYRNEELAAGFSEWARKNRPAEFPEPPAKGGHKPIDWQKKLRDLGVMRLLNKYTVGALPFPAPQGCPEAATNFARWKEHSQWSAARKRALKNFRDLLPFLPANEKPKHAGTKGGRAKL